MTEPCSVCGEPITPFNIREEGESVEFGWVCRSCNSAIYFSYGEMFFEYRGVVVDSLQEFMDRHNTSLE